MYIMRHFIVFLIIFVFSHSCQENITGPDDFVEPEMILIDNYLTFTFGPSWDSTVYDVVDSLPIINLSPYYMGKFELTNEEFYSFIIDSGYVTSSYWSQEGWEARKDSNWTKPKYWSEREKPWESDPFSNKDDTPVHGISFYEAKAYCAWLSVKTGMNYHLPFSTQWVRAAKGPDPGTKYTWGNEYNDAFALHPIPPYVSLVSVSTFPGGKSHEGCYNMIGNVYEICVCIRSSDENFPCIYSSGILSGASSPEQLKEAMTTISQDGINKSVRRYAIGMRICRD